MAGEKVTIKKEDPKKVGDPLAHSPVEVAASVITGEKKAAGTNANIGLFCEPLIEPIPNFIQAGCEHVISHQNLNANIVLGRDRPSTRFSGYGGAGSQRAAAIDIVVGRAGPSPASVDSRGEKFWVDNNFQMDAARIHISQRSNVDQNFGIKSGFAASARAASSIGIKADCVRLIARKDIKIVTGTDFYNSAGAKPGVDFAVPAKICLIGNNRDDLLQPMVRGDNLFNFLTEITDVIHRVLSTIDTLVMHQNKINQAVMGHSHISPFYGLQASPSGELISTLTPITKLLTDVKISGMEIAGLIESSKAAYLTLPSDGAANETNILSDYNFCN